jgi:hypothetical protein
VTYLLAFVVGVALGAVGTLLGIRVWLTVRWSEKG